MLKHTVLDKVRELYCLGLDANCSVPAEEEEQYRLRVLPLAPNRFRASLLWLVQRNAIAQAQADRLDSRCSYVPARKVGAHCPIVLHAADLPVFRRTCARVEVICAGQTRHGACNRTCWISLSDPLAPSWPHEHGPSCSFAAAAVIGAGLDPRGRCAERGVEWRGPGFALFGHAA
jgi:hypothetical protein